MSLIYIYTNPNYQLLKISGSGSNTSLERKASHSLAGSSTTLRSSVLSSEKRGLLLLTRSCARPWGLRVSLTVLA